MVLKDSYKKYAAEWAERIRSGKNLALTYLEKPAMYNQVGDVSGKNILCIGCGSGEECDYLMKQGAKSVVGIDISASLIEIAKKSYSNIEFKVMDLNNIDFPEKSFDLIYSSLVMHYAEDWTIPLRSIHSILKDGCFFVFSTHHPALWSSETINKGDSRKRILGYEINQGKKLNVFGDYHKSRKIKDIWFGHMPVEFYHKPLEDIFHEIKKACFFVDEFLEPQPQEEVAIIDPDFFEKYNKIPFCIIMQLEKRKKDDDIHLI